MPDFGPRAGAFVQNFTVIDLPNFPGREADSIAQHILLRYDTLANYTVFAQVTLPPYYCSHHLLWPHFI